MGNNKTPLETYRVQPEMTQYPAQHIVMIRPDILNRDSDIYFIQIAKALQDFGHRITIITCSSNLLLIHKNMENFHVISTSTWIPVAIFGKFKYPMYLLRTLATAFKYIMIRLVPRPSVVFCNASCVALPILALDKRSTTIHMQNPLELQFISKNLDFKFLDLLLKKSLFFPEEIIVPDNNTKKILEVYFHKKNCSILYPCADLQLAKANYNFDVKEIVPNFPRNGFLFCSFGEYYVQSNFELALAGFCIALNMVDTKYNKKMHLVLGGNLDPTDQQQKEYFSKIKRLVYVKMYTTHITLLETLTEAQKKCLMFEARAIVHPTLDDQFSGTILEAMCLAKTVIATNCSFGKEVLINQITGYLVAPNPMDFAEIIEKIINNKILPVYVGNLAETEFRYKYSYYQFSNCINRIVSKHNSKYCCRNKCNVHKSIYKSIY